MKGRSYLPDDQTLPIIKVSSKSENQINKAITSCFYAVKPRVVYSTRAMPLSAKIDSVPATQKVVLLMNFRADVKLGMQDALRRD